MAAECKEKLALNCTLS